MAIFASKHRNQVVILVPTETVLDELRRPMTIKGKHAVFTNGRYITENAYEIDMLRNHLQFGIEFHEVPEISMAKRFEDVQVTTGAAATMRRDSVVIPDKGTSEDIKTDNLKEEILAAVDVKMASAMDMILSAINAMPKEAPKPKKTFKCPHCDEVFKSGFAVSDHKKAAHAEVI